MTLMLNRISGMESSLAFKAPVYLATTENITLSGFQTIDGVLPTESTPNLRILVKDQTDARTNGIYEMANGLWQRARDFDGNSDFVHGTRFFVTSGVTQSGSYVVTTADPIVVGTSDIVLVSGDISDLFSTVSVFDFIPEAEHAAIIARTSSYDCTTDIQAALNTGKNVFLPKGRYLVTALLTLAAGQRMMGAGRYASKIYVDAASFNMAAIGVLRLVSTSSLENLAISFAQPNSLRVSLNQYPWAITMINASRVEILNVQLEGAWDGINATGNTGGLRLIGFEHGAINRGVVFGGALDFVHINSFHAWPFGFTQSNQLLAWADGGTIAADLTDIDGLDVQGFCSYQGKLIIDGRTFGTMTNVDLDASMSRIDFGGTANVQITSLYKTAGSVAGGYLLRQTAGELVVVGCNIDIGAIGVDVVQVTGGRSKWSSIIASAGPVDAAFFHVNNSQAILSVNDCDLIFGINSIRTEPYIKQTLGRLSVFGCRWPDKGIGSGNAVGIATNDWHIVTGNQFLDWPVSLPGSTSLMYVNGNDGADATANSGATYVGLGSAAAPSLAFQSEKTTGLYRVGSSTPGMAVAGVGRTRWDGSAFSPVTNDGYALGIAGLLAWSDFALASGAVIDWASSDLTLTHAANLLTLAGGTLVLPSSGLQVGSSNPFSDAAGVLTLQNVDALDATTEATIEAALDTLTDMRLNGNTGLAAAGLSNVRLTIGGTVTSADTAFGVYMGSLVLKPATANDAYFQYAGAGSVDTDVSNTVPKAVGFYAASMSKVGTGTVTNSYAAYFNVSTLATNNYGIYSAGQSGVGILPALSTNLNLAAGTTAKSSLRIASGAAPTSPVDGDIWYDGTDLNFRNSATSKTIHTGVSTGWAAATGTATRTTFATGSVTLPVLAEHVKALIDDLTTRKILSA